MTTTANMGGLLGASNPAPGTTPWWTDAQAQGTPTGPYGNLNVNPGGAGQDYSSVQNLPTAMRGSDPGYAAALQQLGYTGSPDDATALNQFLQQNGLTSKTSFNNNGNQTSALFDANGQQAAGTQRTYGSDPGDNAFLMAMLAAGGFGAGAAAGVGVDAAAAGGDAASSSAAGGGLAGTDLPAYSAYGGAGSGASAPLAGDATGTGILGGGGAASSGAAVDGAGGMSLAEGATPASLGGTSLGSLSGLSGGSLLSGAGDMLGNAGSSAANWAMAHPGSAIQLAGLGAGALSSAFGGGSSGSSGSSAQYVPKPATPFTSHVTPQYQPVQQQTGLLTPQPGQQNSGLWRFLNPQPQQGLLGQKTIMPVNPNSPGAQ